MSSVQRTIPREDAATVPPDVSSESGVTAIEYSLIAALIALAIIASLVFVGGEVAQTYLNVADAVESATS